MTEEAKQTILPKVEQEVSSSTIQSSALPFTHKDFLQIQQAIRIVQVFINDLGRIRAKKANAC